MLIAEMQHPIKLNILMVSLTALTYEAVRGCPFSSTLCHTQKIILGISTICLR